MARFLSLLLLLTSFAKAQLVVADNIISPLQEIVSVEALGGAGQDLGAISYSPKIQTTGYNGANAPTYTWIDLGKFLAGYEHTLSIGCTGWGALTSTLKCDFTVIWNWDLEGASIVVHELASTNTVMDLVSKNARDTEMFLFQIPLNNTANNNLHLHVGLALLYRQRSPQENLNSISIAHQSSAPNTWRKLNAGFELSASQWGAITWDKALVANKQTNSFIVYNQKNSIFDFAIIDIDDNNKNYISKLINNIKSTFNDLPILHYAF